MAAAAAVIHGRRITLPVIVIEDQVLALVSNDIRDAFQLLCVFGDQKGARVVADDHSGRVNETTLIVDRTRILGCTDGDVRRISAFAILGPISTCYVDRIIGIIQASAVTVLVRENKEVSEAFIDDSKHGGLWARHRINLSSLRRSLCNC